jgi:ABC-type sugar transport system substrate-binding protein
MKKLNVIVSLSTDASDFQRQQAKTAQEAASRLGAEIKIIYAQNDAIAQGEQLLKAIQGESRKRPDAILVQPCGRTGLPQVARAAALAGIGWGLLNWPVDYLSELRAASHVPVFLVSSDQHQIGRIQGQQMAALLPQGGSILYIQGPSSSAAAQQRAAGMAETKPDNIQVRLVKTDGWTEECGGRAVNVWLRLSIAQKDRIAMIMGQNDLLALGARYALLERGKLGGPLFTGVDGLPEGGQKWVHKGYLAATIIVPANAGQALELLVEAFKTGAQPPEVTLTVPVCYPSIEELSRNTPTGN